MSQNARKVACSPDKAIVMVVDDMQSMRMITRTSLKEMGFKKFVECSNGQEALKRLRLMNINLVICDWDMPEMNGLDLLQEIRSDERLEKIPFIMLTAHSETELIHQSITAGVDSYIVKPYQPRALCLRVNTLLKTPVTLSEA